MKKSKIVGGYDLSGVTSLHGLDHEQYFELMKFQDFKCAISGFEFVYDNEKKKFIDSRGDWLTAKGRTFPKKAPPLDHCHQSGFIRGILSENLNRLMDQWSHNTYGNITKPPELDEYGDNPPAYRSIGRIVSSNFRKKYRRKKKVDLYDKVDNEVDIKQEEVL